MTDEQINIAIAEACGWRCCKRDMRIAELVHTHPYHGLVGIEPTAKEYDGSKDWQYWVIPNYCDDLNAMHEAEESLNHLQQCEFAEKLFRVMIGEDGVSEFMKIHSTAAQRAEAFLRTIGKWEEQP